MLRSRFALCLVVVSLFVAQPFGLFAAPVSRSSQAGAPSAAVSTASTPARTSADAPITPAEAAPFLGDWSIPVTSTAGTYGGTITLKVEGNEVVALLTADVVPEQRTTDIVKSGKGIAIRAKMTYEGLLVEKPTPVSLSVAMTPAGDYVNVGLDFRINNKSFFITSTAKRIAP